MGTLETDLKRIRKLSEEREDENWKFRSFLKFCDHPPEKIDRVVHETCREVSAKIDCTRCGNCCEAVKPVLDIKDIKKFSEGMEISSDQFKRQYLVEDKEEDGFVFKTSPCPFLENKTCTQYLHRPSVCESFPHLHKKEFISRLMSVIGNCSICPIVFNVYERLKTELWY